MTFDLGNLLFFLAGYLAAVVARLAVKRSVVMVLVDGGRVSNTTEGLSNEEFDELIRKHARDSFGEA